MRRISRDSNSLQFTYGHASSTAFAEYTVLTEIPAGTRKLESNEGIPWSAWLGVLGMPGQTSYMGWKEYARAKKVRPQLLILPVCLSS